MLGARHSDGAIILQSKTRDRSRAFFVLFVAIAIDRVSKRFPLPGDKEGVLALSELSLGIAPGEFVAILGPSGCG